MPGTGTMQHLPAPPGNCGRIMAGPTSKQAAAADAP